MTASDHIRILDICGYEVTVDDALGKLCVAHDGTMSWDRLQVIKNAVWGSDSRAIEVYPREADVVNNGCYRHLWRLGKEEFCPSLLGDFEYNSYSDDDVLRERCCRAWEEAHGVYR